MKTYNVRFHDPDVVPTVEEAQAELERRGLGDVVVQEVRVSEISITLTAPSWEQAIKAGWVALSDLIHGPNISTSEGRYGSGGQGPRGCE